MNHTWNTASAILKTCFFKKPLCKFISNIFDPFIIQCKRNCFDRSNIASNCDGLFTASLHRATSEHSTVSSQIMKPVITILISINKEWMMAQGTFANSTQRKEYQGIKYTWEGSYNLMKIQLAHFRNGLCTRNKISKKEWKIRASSQESDPPTFTRTASRVYRLCMFAFESNTTSGSGWCIFVLLPRCWTQRNLEKIVSIVENDKKPIFSAGGGVSFIEYLTDKSKPDNIWPEGSKHLYSIVAYVLTDQFHSVESPSILLFAN